ncbi:MAG TPA: flagellar hook-basal body protein [bacterium]|nr:flagellar hook-basal body protein [bacterium]
MPSGLYIAASGMDSTLARQSVIANNLANVSTIGFKQNRAVDEAFPTYLIARLHDQRMNVLDGTAELRPNIGFMGGGVIPQEITTDYSQGAHLDTKNPLDFALNGPGFFSILNPDGKTLLTRDGNFSLDGNGRLVTQDGLPVLGHNGEIYIDGSQVTVDAEGNINVDGKALDQLLLVKVQDEGKLTKVGHSLFAIGPNNKVDMAPDDIRVEQGTLEQSNVNSVLEMVNMIDTYRSYELNSRIISTYDSMMNLAATQIGSLRV